MIYVLLFMLVGHALGEFYFRVAIKQKKNKNQLVSFFLHIFIYSLSYALTLLSGFILSKSLILLWVGITLIHCIIEMIILFFGNTKREKGIFYSFKKMSFFVSLLFHFALIGTLTILCGGQIDLREYLSSNSILSVLVMLVGLTYILKPVSSFISEFFVVSGLFKAVMYTETQVERFIRAGRIIGMLERILTFFLILANQYAAIGFLLTAKTVTRFKDLESRDIAEYYLIGTLLSMVSVVLIAMVCKHLILHM